MDNEDQNPAPSVTEWSLWDSIGTAIENASTQNPLFVFCTIACLGLLVILLGAKYAFEKMRRNDRFRHKEQIYNHRNATNSLRVERMRVLIDNRTGPAVIGQTDNGANKAKPIENQHQKKNLRKRLGRKK